jgi:acetyl-CoA carboxylase biotin carboxyl carrier protein
VSAEANDPMDEAAVSDTSPIPAGDAGGPVAVGPGEPSASVSGGRSRPREGDTVSVPGDGAADPADVSLLALVDRLAAILERSELGEVEVGAGGTTIVLRSPAAVERSAVAVAAPAEAPAAAVPSAAPAGVAGPAAGAPAPARPSVKAPLTGIYYGAPSPGATPYVAAGDHVAVGQIIGLIEAMKLFNEIKSDLAGRVVRICADNGQLVKAKQPLIEVEPA